MLIDYKTYEIKSSRRNKTCTRKTKETIDQKILKKGKELKRLFKIGVYVEMFQSWVANTWSGKIIDRWTGILPDT